ncbi:helix-turn-helix domain-containing protein [Leucobacter rhizosphaerae]|uniref:Helix-turn-helix domain-containing protein n=1 Tax=Leucobacter rhizosphaerae TaxID=2932245 RepID=A0ABY4FSE9_9MICO|nr:PucR family transcriptional regulator [Leucobacter rhizosphaerae]UOQ59191.1 helix-turn-helix domain-containing protein [Leucobacter rhizosphaerae]
MSHRSGDSTQSRFGSYATLRTLLAERSLNLEAVQVPEYLLDRSIRWVTVTEMVDPAPYLLGDELILTLGSAWEDPESPEIERFIQRISSVGVTAVGIAVGLSHQVVPQRMIDAASQYGLPLISVPLTTTLRSIGEYIVDYTLGDKFAAVQSTLQAHTDLTEALTSRLGMEGLLTRLRRLLTVPVAVVDYWGNLIASQPTSTPWPIEEIIARRTTLGAGDTIEGTSVYPVLISDQRVAFVCTLGVGAAPEIMRFALGLVALELSRRQAEQHGRRELLGQVISDYIQGDLADFEAQRRLARGGMSFESPNRVVLARVECAPRLLEDIPWNVETLVPAGSGSYAVALVDGIVAVMCSEQVPVDELEQALHRHLDRLGETRIGVGSPYSGVAGLRLSWLEAQGSMRSGISSSSRGSMHLPRLMLASLKVPLRSVGEQILRSLLEYDRDNDSDLVHTLQVYLDADCQSAEAAQALFVHRNTLRYRLRLIEKLTGCDLNSFEDLVNFYLAVRAMEMG